MFSGCPRFALPVRGQRPCQHTLATSWCSPSNLGGLTCRFSWSGWPWRCAPGVSSPACGSAARKGAGPPARSPAGTAPGAGRAGLAGRPASLLRTAGARLGVERGEAHQRPAKTACPAPSKSLSLCPFLGPVGSPLVKKWVFSCLNYCLQRGLICSWLFSSSTRNIGNWMF